MPRIHPRRKAIPFSMTISLAESDWRALKDVTLTAAWREYRSALRDLPQDFPDSANDACDNWPVMPDE